MKETDSEYVKLAKQGGRPGECFYVCVWGVGRWCDLVIWTSRCHLSSGHMLLSSVGILLNVIGRPRLPDTAQGADSSGMCCHLWERPTRLCIQQIGIFSGFLLSNTLG